MSNTTKRTFIAVEIPDAVRASLTRTQAQLKRTGVRVSWVRQENIHLTLVFLGNVSADLIPALSRAMDHVAGEVPAFEMAVEGLGTFGSPRSPRVVWAGIAESSGALSDLQKGLSAAVAALGVPVEARPFHAHLTLGRVRSGKGAGALTSAVTSASVTAHGLVRVGGVSLFESQLQSDGARYTILHTATLKGDS